MQSFLYKFYRNTIHGNCQQQGKDALYRALTGMKAEIFIRQPRRFSSKYLSQRLAEHFRQALFLVYRPQ